MKGAQLLDIEDTAGEGHCEYCGARLRWHYVLLLVDKKTIRVGSECVKSFLDDGDPKAAMAFFRDAWTQRRTYYYKRFAKFVWVIGQSKKTGGWYVAATESLRDYGWNFLTWCDSQDDAKGYLMEHVMQKCWVGKVIRETREKHVAALYEDKPWSAA